MSRLVAQRYAEVVKPPPAQAPGFRKVQQDVAAKKQRIKQHKTAASESKSAQDAAVAPPDDKQAQGKAANAEKMNEAEPGEFDKNAFVGAVNDAIAAQAPKNLDEADGFADSGKADTIKDSVDGKVKEGKESSAEDIESTTTAAPDTSQAKEKQVTPMGPDQPPGNPGAPSAADAVPAKQPDKVLDLSEGNQRVDQQMADAEVTEEQLAKGNEPQFDAALSEKKKGEQHTASVPAKGRAAEAKQLSAAQAGAAASGAAAMTAMTADRAAAGKTVDGGKGGTKSADEKKREQVTAKLQKVFDATQKDVEKILGDLDGKVDKQFTEGEKRTRDDFTADHKRRMKQYKDKRYSGFTGKGRWIRDKFKGLPQEGLDIFKKSRELYVTKMRAVISSIADTIGTELGRAKARIATGRAELKAEVDRLPADLKQFGEEAAADFAGKFDDLESEVNDKSTQLVQDLAQKYTEALNSVDEEIKKLEEENKGLIAKVVDAVAGVIQTIMELKNLLMGILAKAAGAIGKIIKDPIGFLRNLVSAVGSGLNLFIGNIAAHLQKGLVSWLLGTAVSTGLEIPARFDLKGIIQLIASLLGLTWDNIRARVTRKGVPDEAMTKAEQSVPVAQALAREGPAGAAQEITAETGDLKSTILDDLKSYLIPTVLMAGITWILSLLNPASAFIRAVKGIIDIVTFIVTQGAQIVEFVNSVLDAVVAIANGAAAAVPKTVETALAASIPLLIGLLASLLGIGGLANRVRQAFQKVSRPVNRAIDKIVDKIAKAAKKLRRKDKRKRRSGGKDGGKGGGKGGERGGEGAGGKRDVNNSDEKRSKKRFEDVFRRTRRDVNQRFNGLVEPRELKRISESVLQKNRGIGLKDLTFRTRSQSSGEIELVARVNPIRAIAIAAIPRFTLSQMQLQKQIATHAKATITCHFPDSSVQDQKQYPSLSSGRRRINNRIDLAPSVPSPTGTGTIPTVTISQTSNDRAVHAEEMLTEELNNDWSKYIPNPMSKMAGVSPMLKLDLRVNRSCCPGCAHHVTKLQDTASQKGWEPKFTVLATRLYMGEFDTAGRREAGLDGLRILMGRGVSVEVLDMNDPSMQTVRNYVLNKATMPDGTPSVDYEDKYRDLWNKSLADAVVEVAAELGI
ncbi:MULTISPECIES: hypothetical protein [unclassified Streptomyces]|uniref:hypothetical protein n=1 Tax=unclassified Streptomyces TaxID=2593676 RepID=UPI0034160454